MPGLVTTPTQVARKGEGDSLMMEGGSNKAVRKTQKYMVQLVNKGFYFLSSSQIQTYIKTRGFQDLIISRGRKCNLFQTMLDVGNCGAPEQINQWVKTRSSQRRLDMINLKMVQAPHQVMERSDLQPFLRQELALNLHLNLHPYWKEVCLLRYRTSERKLDTVD